ncbi:MAG: hypothetical protein M5R36_01510 [Deltaproteobacteria bacterium]|nr:hypothetical protein [Deltaproteobacteria bacterium]
MASGGVMGAMAGGMLATIAAEPLKVLGYLRKATRKSASAA